MTDTRKKNNERTNAFSMCAGVGGVGRWGAVESKGLFSIEARYTYHIFPSPNRPFSPSNFSKGFFLPPPPSLNALLLYKESNPPFFPPPTLTSHVSRLPLENTQQHTSSLLTSGSQNPSFPFILPFSWCRPWANRTRKKYLSRIPKRGTKKINLGGGSSSSKRKENPGRRVVSLSSLTCCNENFR